VFCFSSTQSVGHFWFIVGLGIKRIKKPLARTKRRAHWIMFFDALLNVIRAVDPKGVLGYYNAYVWTLMAATSTSSYIIILFLLITISTRAYYEMTARRKPPQLYIWLCDLVGFASVVLWPIQEIVGFHSSFYFWCMIGAFLLTVIAVNAEFYALRRQAQSVMQQVGTATDNSELATGIRKMALMQCIIAVLVSGAMAYFLCLAILGFPFNPDPDKYEPLLGPLLVIEIMAHPVSLWYFWIKDAMSSDSSGNSPRGQSIGRGDRGVTLRSVTAVSEQGDAGVDLSVTTVSEPNPE